MWCAAPGALLLAIAGCAAPPPAPDPLAGAPEPPPFVDRGARMSGAALAAVYRDGGDLARLRAARDQVDAGADGVLAVLAAWREVVEAPGAAPDPARERDLVDGVRRQFAAHPELWDGPAGREVEHTARRRLTQGGASAQGPWWRLLAASPRPPPEELLIALLASQDPFVAMEASDRLAQQGDAVDCAPLLGYLERGEPDVRRRAVLLLRRLAAQAAQAAHGEPTLASPDRVWEFGYVPEGRLTTGTAGATEQDPALARARAQALDQWRRWWEDEQRRRRETSATTDAAAAD